MTWFIASHAAADSIVAFVSDASAPELASAGATFAARHPGHRLVFRSTSQVARATDDELRGWITRADAVVLVAVFGDDVDRIATALRASSARHVLPLHADTRFVPLSRLDGMEPFRQLSADQGNARLAQLANALAPRTHPPSSARADVLIANARRYRAGRGAENLANLLAWVTVDPNQRHTIPPPTGGETLRFVVGDRTYTGRMPVLREASVAIVDYDYGDQAGDREIHRALCVAFRNAKLGCVSVLAQWGAPSAQALRAMSDVRQRNTPGVVAVVMLQDFAAGVGAGTTDASRAIEALDVPVFKAVRIAERTVAAWRASEDGLPVDSVHYRLAMPEMQGTGQPFVVAAAGRTAIDKVSGVELKPLTTIDAEIHALARRVSAWRALQTKANREKRIAIVYYNHPPGRHNIGADNLDVPASLLAILRQLKSAGYNTGRLPKDREALLDLLQDRGVNLPENGTALRTMARRAATMSSAQYLAYFRTLPETTRLALTDGPLGALVARSAQATREGAADVSNADVKRILGDVQHLLEGAAHPARTKALSKLELLRQAYNEVHGSRVPNFTAVQALTKELQSLGIEGLRGWGAPPGRVMVSGDDLVVPGVTFGNVFVGPQPPRGWELDEEILHANLAFAPPHQYLAFYEHVRRMHNADVVVHLGRHSTYEFLPGRRTGVGADDFSRVVLGDLPSVYIYIVDGVGEGIQAKRRGQAVIIDHLTPSLSTTPLYDELLELRQLVESYEASASADEQASSVALSAIRATIDRLHLRDALAQSMRDELRTRKIGFDEVDGELLVHEVGHFLTSMQEQFMPHGLHVFGEPWTKTAVDRMLTSMAGDQRVDPRWRKALIDSPRHEARALLHALNGKFTAAGPGNDPIRTPEVLPTGRNFHALDASVLPTRLGFALGTKLAQRARAESSAESSGAEAVVLWASDTVRDEGAMVSFGLGMLGIEPVWNSRGIVRSLQRVPIGSVHTRRDTTFVTSGLFRDLYGSMLVWLDLSVLLAIDGASKSVLATHPELSAALNAALAPLGAMRTSGAESLSQNLVAANWVHATRRLIAAGIPANVAGPRASARVFGNAPGGYGAGVNNLAERSGAWRTRDELARAYTRRMGHVYGVNRSGEPMHNDFRTLLARVEHTYLGRASNLYGLIDNNDAFDYLGGLGLAVEHERGAPPTSRVISHADPSNASLDALPMALHRELRGRHLNPVYLKGLMAHGYAGARTVGSEFVENLWGWQVTSPHIVKSWMWDDVKSVLLDDKHGIGFSKFLAEGHNVHVRTNMQAVLLVAAHKGFWTPDEATLDALSTQFAQSVVDHGLPGSGHTRPDHPMMTEIAARLEHALAESFKKSLSDAAGSDARATATTLRRSDEAADPDRASAQSGTKNHALIGTIALCAIALVALGAAIESRRKNR